jgi:uncharacterized protein (DUF1684 family)
MRNNLSETYEQKIEEWRSQQETRLRADDGWLTVVGLWWLHNGENTIGSGATKDIQLPSGYPENFGTISLQGDHISLVVSHTENVWIDDTVAIAAQSYTLLNDETKNKTLVNIDNRISFFIIKRSDNFGVRVKDKESEIRQNFKGRLWYPILQDWVITATWIPLQETKDLVVPDVLGNATTEKVSGYVEFHKDGKIYRLYPTTKDGKLFFVFRDTTSGKYTYGLGRFLSTELPKDGIVQLDFNKAVNPPCAFTNFATCPIPTKENILTLAIEAGELKPH